MNFLQETIKELIDNNKSEQDVLWVIDDDKKITWETFKEKADFMYDTWCDGIEINPNLKVVGKDFWLEREEFDGCAWWEFRQAPIVPEGNNVDEIELTYRLW